MHWSFRRRPILENTRGASACPRVGGQGTGSWPRVRSTKLTCTLLNLSRGEMGPPSEKCDEMPRWPTSWRGDVCCLASSGCALASWPGLPSPAWARPVPGLEPAWVGGLSDTSCLGWNWLNYSLISGQKWPILTLEVRRVAPSLVLDMTMVGLKRLFFFALVAY